MRFCLCFFVFLFFSDPDVHSVQVEYLGLQISTVVRDLRKNYLSLNYVCALDPHW